MNHSKNDFTIISVYRNDISNSSSMSIVSFAGVLLPRDIVATIHSDRGSYNHRVTGDLIRSQLHRTRSPHTERRERGARVSEKPLRYSKSEIVYSWPVGNLERYWNRPRATRSVLASEAILVGRKCPPGKRETRGGGGKEREIERERERESDVATLIPRFDKAKRHPCGTTLSIYPTSTLFLFHSILFSFFVSSSSSFASSTTSFFCLLRRPRRLYHTREREVKKNENRVWMSHPDSGLLANKIQINSAVHTKLSHLPLPTLET